MTSPTALRRPGRRLAGPLAALTMTIALAAGLAACSSSDSSGDFTGESGGDSAATLTDERPADAGSEAGRTAPREAASPTEGDADASLDSDEAGSGGTADGAARAPAIERSVISTGTVSLVSDDVATARRDVQRIVDAQQGTVSQEQTETDDDGDASYSRLVVRVPSRSFSATMQALEKAAELRQSQVTSDDVTTEVIDTGVRVRAQESSLRRVEQLLARAGSLRDIIWIESQLTRRQGELDSLKSQQAWLADQTSESTITIDIERKQEPEEKEETEEETGFLAGLTDGMSALGGFATAMATITGALLPFAIVLGVLALPVWLLVRRSARRRTTTTSQPASS